VIFALDGAHAFLESRKVVGIFAAPIVTAVIGGPHPLLGCALVGGDVVPVLAVGSAVSLLLLCREEQDLLGLCGFTDLCPGTFEAEGAGVRHQGKAIPCYALEVLRNTLLTARWTARSWPVASAHFATQRSATNLAPARQKEDRNG
jgi:hypothetical protein